MHSITSLDCGGASCDRLGSFRTKNERYLHTQSLAGTRHFQHALLERGASSPWWIAGWPACTIRRPDSDHSFITRFVSHIPSFSGYHSAVRNTERLEVSDTKKMEELGPMFDASPTGSPIDKTGGGFGQMDNMQMDNMRNNFSGRPNFNPGRFGNGMMGNTTQAPVLLGLGGTLLFISICLLAARLWSRARPSYRLKHDDWTVLAATVGFSSAL